MRKTKFLRTLSVTAAALCAALVMVYCGSPTGGDDEDKPKVKPSLTSLELVYVADGAKVELDREFDSAVFGYKVVLDRGHVGKTIKVNAVSSVKPVITVGGAPAGNDEVEAPGFGAVDKQINIGLGSGELTATYTVTLTAPQTDDEDDFELKSLDVRYSASDNNLVTNVGKNMSIQIERGQRSAIVSAEARSSKSTVEIWDGDRKIGSGNGKASASSPITLPGLDEESQLKVVVKKFNGSGNCPYELAISGPYSATIIWTGTAEYEGDGYEVESVTAYNGSNRKQLVKLESPLEGKNGKQWSLSINELWGSPVKFTVALIEVVDSDDKTPGRKGSGFIPIPDGSTPATPIELKVSGANTGVQIVNANQFFQLLGAESTAQTSYALGNDIDLDDYTLGGNDGWKGPSGYKGKFYGNNYTITNLKLSRTSGNVGLFNSLGSGAELADFTVYVSTANDEMAVSGMIFGGIVGELGNGTITIRNVKVEGTLKFKSFTNAVTVGGLIGQSSGKSIIENCVSAVNIVVSDSLSNSNSTVVFAGFIGYVTNDSSNVQIKNCYATGDIEIRNPTTSGGATPTIYAGGFLGRTFYVGQPTVSIENSYASGDIFVDSGSRTLYAGGLLGYKNNGTVTIKNSAALNKKIIGVTTGTKYLGRVAGNTDSSTTLRNFALDTMIVGGDPEAEAVSNLGGEAASKDGYGVSLTDFQKEATWKDSDPTGLEFNGANGVVWDFSGLSTGWPTLTTIKTNKK